MNPLTSRTAKQVLCRTMVIAAAISASVAHANIIDATYGTGAGSFELGAFADEGRGYMGLSPGSTLITGWTVGGPGSGVDWLSAPIIGVHSGQLAVDLINTSDGSISTDLPTVVGQQYRLTFHAAAVTTGNALGLVSAGSLDNQEFTPVLTDGRDFANQVYSPFSFNFFAEQTVTTLRFQAGVEGCFPDCYGPVIDSVVVSAVPEPSEQWLFVAGLLTLIPSLGRRGRALREGGRA